MTELSAEDRKLRNDLKAPISRLVGGDDRAEIIMQRIADRLGGYTHDEAVARHPMPEDSDD